MIFSARMLSLVSALALMLSAGNAAVPPTADTRAAEQYTIHLNSGEEYTFDGNGKFVPPEQQFDLLKDIVTGEPQYKHYTRIEDTGKDYDDGSPKVRYLCALYDMEDKLLADWGEYGYRDAFGDYVVKMDSALTRSMVGADEDNYCVLWNTKTGKVAMDGVERVQRVNDSSVLLLPPGYNNSPLGIMDMDGAEPVFRPFPEGYTNVQILDNSYMIADIDKGGDEKNKTRDGVLMTKDYKVLLKKPRLNGRYIGLRGPYFSSKDGEKTSILSMDGKLLYTLPPECENYNYFDGELVVPSMLEDPVKRVWTQQLVKVDGTKLTGAYDRIIAVDKNEFESDAPSKLFLGKRGETVELLDRNGKVVTTQTIPRLIEISMVGDGYCDYSLLPEADGANSGVAEDNDLPEFHGLLGAKLEIILPADKYTYIQEEYGIREDGTRGPVGLLTCTKTISGGARRIDILDTSGKLLIENLTQSGETGPDRIAVVKGFSIGVMDWQGNWIGKHSIFGNLEDEERMRY